MLNAESFPVWFDTIYQGNKVNMQMLFPKGFSANLVLITWSIFGSVLAYGFLANLRNMMLRPVLEDPVDSFQDVLDRGLIPFTFAGNQIMKIYMMNSPVNVTRTIGEMLYVPKTWEEEERMVDINVLEGTHVYLSGDSYSYTYYMSKDTLGGYYDPGSDLSNKKWPLIGDFNKICHGYIQVCHGYIHLFFLLGTQQR